MTQPIDDLAKDSVKLIEWNQHPSGGYVASPLFTHYNYSWLRDGSFIAYGMDCAGIHDSAERFYEWVHRILERKQEHIHLLVEKHKRGEIIEQHEFLHTRYHLDGRDDDNSEWGHFQLDGYGTWLWTFAEHLRLTGQDRIPDSFRTSVDASVDYLCAFWKLPNFDCWEENSEHIHPATLACIYGGLKAIAVLEQRTDLEKVCGEIKQFILDFGTHPDGHFVKYITSDSEKGYKIGNADVDGSLMWLCKPFDLFEPDYPAMKQTIEKVKTDLQTESGGIRRYPADHYYGGGEWLILTAWYGWLQWSKGDKEEAEQALMWVASKADAYGRLPEQVPDALKNKDEYESWVKRWGPPAVPLLWSHAMFLVLHFQLQKKGLKE